MDGRKEMNPVWPMRLYNIAQVATCGYMTVGLCKHLATAPQDLELWPGSGIWVPNLMGFNTVVTPEVESVIYIHYLSKFLDLFDTIFIALKKADARMSFLHLYHHATIGPIWGFLLYVGWGGGTAAFGAMLNSFI